MIPEDLDLKHVVACRHSDPLQFNVQNKRKSLLGDADQLYLSDEKHRVDKTGDKLCFLYTWRERRMKNALRIYGWTTRWMCRLRNVRIELVRSQYCLFCMILTVDLCF